MPVMKPPIPRPLAPFEREHLATHLCALEPDAKRLRFGHRPDDATIRRIVETPPFGPTLVLEEHGRVVGAVELRPYSPASAELGISVARSHRGRGLGRRLFDAALARAASEGIATITVLFAAHNAPMRRLVAGAFGHVEVAAGEAIAEINVAAALPARVVRTSELAL